MPIPSTPMNAFVAWVRRKRVGRERTHHRVARPAVVTAEQEELHVALGGLERDADVVRHDLDAGRPQVTEDLERRRAAVQVEGVARLDHGRGGTPDRTLLVGVAGDGFQVSGLGPHPLRRHSSTMGSLEQPPAFERFQVAADRHLGDPHGLGKDGDPHDAVLTQQLLDAPMPLSGKRLLHDLSSESPETRACRDRLDDRTSASLFPSDHRRKRAEPVSSARAPRTATRRGSGR